MWPNLHLVSLASMYDLPIQYVNARALRDALDFSIDLHAGDDMRRDFPVLLDKKLKNCTDWFLDSLTNEGIIVPLVVIVRPTREWVMDDGHHRLAFACCLDLEVPVLFDDSGDDMESTKRYEVCQSDTLPTDLLPSHSTTPEETAEILVEMLNDNDIRIPRQRLESVGVSQYMGA